MAKYVYYRQGFFIIQFQEKTDVKIELFCSVLFLKAGVKDFHQKRSGAELYRITHRRDEGVGAGTFGEAAGQRGDSV